jgi:hypothetical protein
MTASMMAETRHRWLLTVTSQIFLWKVCTPVSYRGLRIVTFLAELNGLDLWATDIGNAYLEAFTMERNYIVAGREFGQLEEDIICLLSRHSMVYTRLDYIGMNALPIVSAMKASQLARQNLISG